MDYVDRSAIPTYSAFLTFLRGTGKLFSIRRMLAIVLISTVVSFAQSIFRADVWRGLRRAIANRAEIDILEDFRRGLDSWRSDQNLMATWSYDPSGFVIPGRLAILVTSVPLTDYNISKPLRH